MIRERVTFALRRVETLFWRAVRLAGELAVFATPQTAHTPGAASRQGQWQHHPDTTEPATGFIQYLRQTKGQP